MYRRIREDWIDVLGEIWMPYGAPAGLRIPLRAYDLENIGEFTRANVERWLSTHAGDFSRVVDFMSAARAWHYSYVRDLAQEALSLIASGEISDREALDRWIDETADGSGRAIYTEQAWMLLAASDNCDAYEDQIGGDATVNGRAVVALATDIREQLSAEVAYRTDDDEPKLPEGFDLEDDSTWRPAP